MVKLFALMVLYKGEETAHVLRDAYDVSSFGYFQVRESVKCLQTQKSHSDIHRNIEMDLFFRKT